MRKVSNRTATDKSPSFVLDVAGHNKWQAIMYMSEVFATSLENLDSSMGEYRKAAEYCT